MTDVTKIAIDPRVSYPDNTVLPNEKFATVLKDEANVNTTDFIEKMQDGQVVSLLNSGYWAPYVSATNGLTKSTNGILSHADTVTNNPGINGTNMIGFLTRLSDDRLMINVCNIGNVKSALMAGYEAACKAKYTGLIFN